MLAKPEPRLIYFAHPLGAPTKEGVAANRARAIRWVRWIYDNFPNVVVIADWLVSVEVFDDTNPEHRTRGIAMNKVIMRRAGLQEFWMTGGRISTGMADEQTLAAELKLREVDLTWLGEEPPAEVPERVFALCA